jgi:hypothetical protein
MKGAVKMSTNRIAMKTPPLVSPQEWEAARQKLARQGEGTDKWVEVSDAEIAGIRKRTEEAKAS